MEGILTRKDLMGFAIEEKLERLLRHPHRKLSRSVVLALRKNYGQGRFTHMTSAIDGKRDLDPSKADQG